jgi:hypothetical protein
MLGICGAINVLPLHAFMVHTGQLYLYPSLYLPSLLLLLLGALHNKFAGLILHGVIGFFINIILLAALWLWG